MVKQSFNFLKAKSNTSRKLTQKISIIHFKSFVIIVTQLADRISIIVKGFFHDRQKAFTELPA
jgi:hypothetical protein